MQKVIKFPKQVAALLLYGVVPGVRLEAQLFESRERLFVYATDELVSNLQLPIEWQMEAYNNQVYGNIPSNSELPNDAFYGWFEVSNYPFVEPPVLSAGQDGRLYRVVCPRIFDHPLVMPDNAYEDFLLEHFLDAIPVYHIHEVAVPMDWGGELELPVNGTLFDTIPRVGKITLDLFGRLATCVLDDNGELKPFTLLTLACGNRRRSFNFLGEIFTTLNENFEPILYPSMLDSTGFDIRKRLVLHCGDPRR